MTRYVRLVTVGPAEDPTSGIYRNRIFDLCDGSLEETRPTGRIGMHEVWSAEALLDALSSYAGPDRLLFVVGMHIESDVDPEPMPEEKEKETARPHDVDVDGMRTDEVVLTAIREHPGLFTYELEEITGIDKRKINAAGRKLRIYGLVRYEKHVRPNSIGRMSIQSKWYPIY